MLKPLNYLKQQTAETFGGQCLWVLNVCENSSIKHIWDPLYKVLITIPVHVSNALLSAGTLGFPVLYYHNERNHTCPEGKAVHACYTCNYMSKVLTCINVLLQLLDTLNIE